MEIKVLGPGCKKCNTLAEATQKAVEELKNHIILKGRTKDTRMKQR